MMSCILVIALLLITILAYLLSKRIIFSPWVIVCGLFFLSAFVSILNRNIWNYDLSENIVIVLILALIMFGIGSLSVQQVFSQIKEISNKHNECLDNYLPLRVSNIVLLAICAFMVIVFVITYRTVYSISVAWGNTEGYRKMLSYMRDATFTTGQMKVPSILGIMEILCHTISLIYMYVFFHNSVLFKFRYRQLILLLPTILYMAIYVLSGARTGFVRVIAEFLTIYFVLFGKKYHWSPKVTGKVLITGISGIFLVCIAFTLAGYLTGKSYELPAFRMVSIYMGGSIPVLDDMLVNPFEQTHYIGEHTMYPIYGYLRAFGFDLPKPIPYWEYRTVGNLRTNIYTALGGYIRDFSMLGMYILQILIGGFYTTIFEIVRHNSKIFPLLLYSLIFFPLALYFYSEYIFAELVSFRTIKEIFCLLISYNILIVIPKRKRQ